MPLIAAPRRVALEIPTNRPYASVEAAILHTRRSKTALCIANRFLRMVGAVDMFQQKDFFYHVWVMRFCRAHINCGLFGLIHAWCSKLVKIDWFETDNYMQCNELVTASRHRLISVFWETVTRCANTVLDKLLFRIVMNCAFLVMNCAFCMAMILTWNLKCVAWVGFE